MARSEVAGLMLGLDTRSGGLMGTTDFPFILANVANKTLRAAYEAAPQTFKPFCRQTTNPDFKTIARTQLGDAPTLDPINEAGEFKRGSTSDAREQYALATYGKVVAVSRQVIINDDLSAFTRLPEMFGRAAADRLDAGVADHALDGTFPQVAHAAVELLAVVDHFLHQISSEQLRHADLFHGIFFSIEEIAGAIGEPARRLDGGEMLDELMSPDLELDDGLAERDSLFSKRQRVRQRVTLTGDLHPQKLILGVDYIVSLVLGRIKQVLDVNVPRPRALEVLTSPVFVEQKRAVLDSFKEESLKAISVMPERI